MEVKGQKFEVRGGVMETVRFGRYLKRARKKASLTQQELARALGVTNTYIYLLESGKIDAPTEKRCRQLAHVLKVDFEEIWDLAKKQRFERFAQRVGLETRGKHEENEEVLNVCEKDLALIRLLEKLDPRMRKDFDGMVFMLLRHIEMEEVAELLSEYMEMAG